MNEFIQELNNCALFHCLSQDELVRLFDLLETDTFDAGTRILVEGRTYRTLWVILRGNCEVVRQSASGADQRLAVLEPGGIFGEMSFLQEAPHSATVRALSEVEVIRFTPTAFEELKSSDPAVAMTITSNLVQLLSDRLRRMDAWICELIAQSEDRRHHAEWKEFQSKLYSDWTF